MSVKPIFSKPWYLFLLLLFFVFHGFVRYFFLVPLADAGLLLLQYVIISSILVLLLNIYFRDFSKAVFLAFLLVSFHLFFGYIHDSLSKLPGITFFLKYSVFLPVVFIIFISLTIFIRRKKKIPLRLTLYLNILFFIFLLIDAGLLVAKLFSDKHQTATVFSCASPPLPDVYLIVPDEYAGNKNLLDVCGFDNGGFSDSLRRRGFFVANNSHSNYDYTIFSMASVLDMDYLPAKPGEIRQDNPGLALRHILTNKVTASFRKAGYEIHNFSSFDMYDQPSQSSNSFIPARTALFTSQTLFSRLKKEAWINLAIKLKLNTVIKDYAYQALRYNEYVYDESMKTVRSKSTGPRFVYTHLGFPHYPYYYDENGQPFPYDYIMKDAPGNKTNYIRYIKYSSAMLLRLVDEIQKNSTTPPVILLMSDHGYRSFPPGGEKYMFFNFFSIYLPGGNYTQFSDTMSNVNVFRALFNTLFCQKLPLLKHSEIPVR